MIFDYIPETFSYIKKNNIQPKALFITHVHFDHIEGLGEFLKEFPDIAVYASAEAKKNINNPEYTLMYGDKNSGAFYRQRELVCRRFVLCFLRRFGFLP